MTQTPAQPRTSQTLEHTFAPRGSALGIFHIRDRELLICGAAGTGKTRACLEKLNAVALKYPGMRGLIVRKTYRTLAASCVAEFKASVVPELLVYGAVKWYGGSGGSPAAFKYYNGSTIELAGMDNYNKIMSTQYDFIFVEEATDLELDDWQALIVRLRNGVMPYQQLLAACNPGADTHFLKMRADEGKIRMLTATHEENPRLFDDDGGLTDEGRQYIEEGLDQLAGFMYLRLRKGLWVGAEGMIFTEFHNGLIVDEMPKGWETWQRYWTVDFGYNHPMVVQCWAEAPDGELYLYREFYRTQRMVEDFAQDILNVVAPYDSDTSEGRRVWIEPKPATIICDHQLQERKILERYLQMGTTAAQKDVIPGIQVVAMRMKASRIYFLRNALVRVDTNQSNAKKPVSTLSEIPGYVWAPSSRNKDLKEEPLKEADDGCDAMRYMVAYKDQMSLVRFRRL